MTEERYADAIGEITLVGPTVRIDLVSLSPTAKDEKGQPRPEFRQRIVMPVDGFLQSFAMMARVMQKMEAQGLIKRPAADAPPPAPPVTTNFK